VQIARPKAKTSPDSLASPFGDRESRTTQTDNHFMGRDPSGLGYWLQYFPWCGTRETELVCVEINPAFVEIGKKMIPEATWICADVFDVLDIELGHFDCAVSNP
ncbi:MAG: hypothetical protein AAF619_13740, partial [Pseudomonadota bacterium]